MENFIFRAVSCVISIRFVGTKIERKCMKQKCLRILTGKKHPKIKAFTENTNIDIWVVGTST